VAATVRIRTEEGEESLDLEELEARISRGEVAPHCPVLFPTPEGLRWVRAGDLELFRARFNPRHHAFARRFRMTRLPALTLLLIAANFVVFLAMRAAGPLDLDAMVLWGAKVLPLIGDLGQTWRLLTANFLHRDWLHIGFNAFVLFNVGGALENAYRPLDYLTLLLASALGCTVTSLCFAGDAISVGASGIAFGCMGAAVVFGVRYREILPGRYRQLLGEAAIPSVLVFLYLGWASPGVDNWGHLGGLLFGAAAAALLPARLLLERQSSKLATLLRAIPLGGTLLLLTFGGRLLAPALPPLQAIRDDDGLSLQVPRTWHRGVERFGPLAFHNGLPGLGRAVFAATARPREPEQPLPEVVANFVKGELEAVEARHEISGLKIQPPRPAQVAGRDGLLLRASYEAEEGETVHVRAYFVPRGNTVHTLVYLLPDAYPDYGRVADTMLEAVRLTEPAALEQARGRALLFPDAPGPQAELGEVLARLGEPLEAARAFERAQAMAPEDLQLPARRARSLLAAGEVESGCALLVAAAGTQAPPLQSLLALADCARARGQRAEIKRWLDEARRRFPEDPEVARATDAAR
jgi:rhomboid protease GluP